MLRWQEYTLPKVRYPLQPCLLLSEEVHFQPLQCTLLQCQSYDSSASTKKYAWIIYLKNRQVQPDNE
jgi:hypothetical protein